MAKKKGGVSKKKRAAGAKRIVDDKTFGLKNKKGNKNKKFIQQVQHQAAQSMNRGNNSKASLAGLKGSQYDAKKLKLARAKEKHEMDKLFATVKEDPKKAAAKAKGKGKQGAFKAPKKKKKKKKKKSGNAPPPPPPVDNRPIEVKIEEKRQALYASGKKLTPVTEESFAKWKKQRMALKKKGKGKKGEKKKLSGRELYSSTGSSFKDAEGAADTHEMKAKSLLEAEIEEDAFGMAPTNSTAEADVAMDESLFLDGDLDDLDDM